LPVLTKSPVVPPPFASETEDGAAGGDVAVGVVVVDVEPDEGLAVTTGIEPPPRRSNVVEAR
jgi:hypothetical protein